MLLIIAQKKIFLSAFVEAGEKGLTRSELAEKVSKNPLGPLFGMRGLDEWIASHIHSKSLKGDIHEISTGRFFITDRGLEDLRKIQSCKKPCNPSCPARLDSVEK